MFSDFWQIKNLLLHFYLYSNKVCEYDPQIKSVNTTQEQRIAFYSDLSSNLFLFIIFHHCNICCNICNLLDYHHVYVDFVVVHDILNMSTIFQFYNSFNLSPENLTAESSLPVWKILGLIPSQVIPGTMKVWINPFCLVFSIRIGLISKGVV